MFVLCIYEYKENNRKLFITYIETHLCVSSLREYMYKNSTHILYQYPFL